MTKFDVTLVEYPATRLIGMKVETSMGKAAGDCGAIWEKFMPGTAELCAPGENPLKNGSFGIAKMINAEDFNYWAAIPAAAEMKVPEGLEEVKLPGGLHAKITIPSLEQLNDAFMYIYGEWPNEQSEYAPNEAAKAFEWYPPNWQPESAFHIFVAVIKLKAV